MAPLQVNLWFARGPPALVSRCGRAKKSCTAKISRRNYPINFSDPDGLKRVKIIAGKSTPMDAGAKQILVFFKKKGHDTYTQENTDRNGAISAFENNDLVYIMSHGAGTSYPELKIGPSFLDFGPDSGDKLTSIQLFEYSEQFKQSPFSATIVVAAGCSSAATCQFPSALGFLMEKDSGKAYVGWDVDVQSGMSDKLMQRFMFDLSRGKSVGEAKELLLQNTSSKYTQSFIKNHLIIWGDPNARL